MIKVTTRRKEGEPMSSKQSPSQESVAEIEEILKEFPAIILEITGVDISKALLDCDDSAA